MRGNRGGQFAVKPPTQDGRRKWNTVRGNRWNKGNGGIGLSTFTSRHFGQFSTCNNNKNEY